MLTVTDNALNAIRTALRNGIAPVAGLRVMVEAGGCSGYKYVLGLESAILKSDEVIEYDEVKVVIDPVSLPLLDGVTMDFVTNLDGAGFVFNNPNASAKCGCGKSFSC
ncbi:MAG: iron-sulfur cluster assembly accessory protein [Alphaproteobacteria bacterium]|nr:iron-sulfur cluster assembly accessory protein [Alphaproteobacteria bacterium]